jgi:hypothetical protein
MEGHTCSSESHLRHRLHKEHRLVHSMTSAALSSPRFHGCRGNPIGVLQNDTRHTEQLLRLLLRECVRQAPSKTLATLDRMRTPRFGDKPFQCYRRRHATLNSFCIFGCSENRFVYFRMRLVILQY